MGERSRRTARSRTALQESRNPAHRCAAIRQCRDAALARCDAGIRGLDRSDGIAAAARALRKGCGAMTMRYYPVSRSATQSIRTARKLTLPFLRTKDGEIDVARSIANNLSARQ